MTKEFESYITDEVINFVKVVNAQEWNNGIRAQAESLLIAYNLMFEILKDVDNAVKAMKPCIKS